MPNARLWVRHALQVWTIGEKNILLRDQAYDILGYLYVTRPQSIRWRVFVEKGISCITCGLTADRVIEYQEDSFYKDGKNRKGIHTDPFAINPKHPHSLLMMTMDHTIPKSKGGPFTFENLQPMCGPCNSKKADHYEGEERKTWTSKADADLEEPLAAQLKHSPNYIL